MDATSGAAAVWWGLGIGLLVLVVIPLVLLLLQKVRRDISEIGYYADDILEHGVNVTGNLDPVPALLDTRDLVATATGGFATYVGLVARILAASKAAS